MVNKRDAHISKWSEVKWTEVAQSCLTLCDLLDYSPAGSSVHEIFQARILEWVAISFSRRSSLPRDWTLVSWIVGRHFTIWTTREVHQEAVRKGAEYRFAKILIKGKMKPKLVEFKWKVLLLSHVWLFATSWTLAHQAPLSMEFSMQEYWSGQLFPSPGNLQLLLKCTNILKKEHAQ